MIDRICIYLYTFLEINKHDHVGANIRFFETGTIHQLKESYLDPRGDIPHPSPALADTKGRFPKIYIDKPYTVVVTNRYGEQIHSEVIE